jgi:hypothetical protein
MKKRMYICNKCHTVYSNLIRESRQRAKEENRLEIFELDLQVRDLCEKNYSYRKVEKFLYPYVKNHFVFETVYQYKKAIWLLEYNLLRSKYAKRRSIERGIALRGMREDPEFNKYFMREDTYTNLERENVYMIEYE